MATPAGQHGLDHRLEVGPVGVADLCRHAQGHVASAGLGPAVPGLPPREGWKRRASFSCFAAGGWDRPGAAAWPPHVARRCRPGCPASGPCWLLTARADGEAARACGGALGRCRTPVRLGLRCSTPEKAAPPSSHAPPLLAAWQWRVGPACRKAAGSALAAWASLQVENPSAKRPCIHHISPLTPAAGDLLPHAGKVGCRMRTASGLSGDAQAAGIWAVRILRVGARQMFRPQQKQIAKSRI